ncbi:MAG: two-component regulator propeller domain-containing protein [Anaerolineae bacterium]
MQQSKMIPRTVVLAICVALVGFMAACRCKTPILPGPAARPVFDGSAREDETIQPLCGAVQPERTSWRQVWRSSGGGGSVTAMLRDGDWLWVATPSGLVRLDLETLNCTRFDSEPTDGESEASIHVSVLLPDPEGRVWAAGYNALLRFDGQAWQSINLDGYNPSGLAFDAEGDLWTEDTHQRGIKLWRYAGHEPPKAGVWIGEAVLPFYPLYQIDCSAWFASALLDMHPFGFRSTGECRLLNDWYERLAELNPPWRIAPWGNYPLIAAESDERLWMLARYLPDENKPYDALLSFDGQRWQVLPWPYGSTNLISADDARGGVWVGTAEGLVFSDVQSFRRYPLLPADAIPVGPQLSDLAATTDGRLWAATPEYGLLQYDEASGSWQPTEITEWVLISADDQGGLWVASRFGDGFVSHFDGEMWTHYPRPAGWPCSPRQILADVGGGVWMSSSCALRGFNGEVWDEYDTGMPGERLARGPRGEVYAVGWNGTLKRLDGTTWKTLLSSSNYGRFREYYRPLEDVFVGPAGDVWMAFGDEASLFVYRGSELEKVPVPSEGKITALLIDSQGNLWVGHEYGLLRYDGQSWESIVSETGLVTVNNLVEDSEGRIWVPRSDGLYVYDSVEE